MPRRLISLLLSFAVCGLSGILLGVAFPPFESGETAWLAFVPFLILCRWLDPVRSFRLGFYTGLIFWLFSMTWLLELRNSWGYLPLVVFGWVALAAYCALYTGIFGYVASILIRNWSKTFFVGNNHGKRFRNRWGPGAIKGIGVIIGLSMCWIGLEYLRSVLFTGFPWNGLGISQYRNPVFVQIAEWGGVYAVSGLIIVVNASIALTTIRIIANAKRPGTGGRIHLELLFGLVFWLICWAVGIRMIRNWDNRFSSASNVHIAVIQPNVPQLKKWSPADVRDIYSSLQTQTELAAVTNPDLVVWPETSVPGYVGHNARLNDSFAVSFVSEIAKETGPLIVGAMEVDVIEGQTNFYNSSFLVDRTGTLKDSYRKQHLVPFGEYVPLAGILPFLGRLAPMGWSCTPGNGDKIFQINTGVDSIENSKRILFSTLICFEDVFAYLSRNAVKNDAELLINQTNDAWFDGSGGPEQHLSHSVFRAVENRTPVVRSANTGVSCYIDYAGRIDAFALENGQRTGFGGTRGFRVKVIKDRRVNTVYTRFGDIFLGIPCAGLVVIFFVLVLVAKSGKYAVVRQRRG